MRRCSSLVLDMIRILLRLYCDGTGRDEILEDVIHHPLEDSRRVGEPKEHDRWFE